MLTVVLREFAFAAVARGSLHLLPLPTSQHGSVASLQLMCTQQVGTCAGMPVIAPAACWSVLFFVTPQEQRIRASHNIKKLSTKVADRITKPFGLKRGPDSRGGTVEAAAAEGESSGGEGNNLTPSASKTELADLIRKNGEEIATSVEIVVEKVGLHACNPA